MKAKVVAVRALHAFLQLRHHTRYLFVEMLLQHSAPVPTFRLCPSYNLAAYKVFVEMLESWAVERLQL
jgi:hypothetical protein